MLGSAVPEAAGVVHVTLPIPRKHISMRLQRDVALRQMGLDPAVVELDHDPALALRKVNAALNDYDPPQHDPNYLRWRMPAEHKVKTFGCKATTAGSDIHLIAKSKRVTRDQEDFRRRMLAKEPGQDVRPGSKWAKGRKLQSRGFERRRELKLTAAE